MKCLQIGNRICYFNTWAVKHPGHNILSLEKMIANKSCYSNLSNFKARRDYFKAMDIVMKRTSIQPERLSNVV